MKSGPGTIETFRLQLHLTERCNRRCVHCYGDFTDNPRELSTPSLVDIYSGFKDMLRGIGGKTGTPPRGQVNITGGEPLMHENLFYLLDIIAGEGFVDFALLSNLSLVTPEIASRLERLRPLFVQGSLEGGSKRHDRIRGDGDFGRILAAIRILSRAGIRTIISFTAHADNFWDFPAAAHAAYVNGASSIWADRLVGIGGGTSLEGLSPALNAVFLSLMAREREKYRRIGRGRFKVAMKRSLQFLAGGGRPYPCMAGKKLLAVMPDGSVYPCRRLPIPVGNALETPLGEIYRDNELLKSLRDCQVPAAGCEKCIYALECLGGAKCQAYAAGRGLFHADPGCPL